MFSLKSLLVAATFATVLPAAALADASSDIETLTVRLDATAYNLASDEGARALLRKIDRAAQRACGERPSVGPGMAGPRRAFRICHAAAMEDAVAQVDAPLLTVRFAELQNRKLAFASR